MTLSVAPPRPVRGDHEDHGGGAAAATLIIVDVGQGAAALLRTPGGRVIAIDAGPPAASEILLARLEAWGSPEVALWVVSHYDADHVGGLARALWGADGRPRTDDDLVVARVWDRGDEPSPQGEAARAYLKSGLPRAAATLGQSMLVDGVRVTVVGPQPGPIREENARSLALCLDVGAFRILTLGDLPAAAATDAAAACASPDLVWLSHHGARDGTSAAFVDAIEGADVVISAGMSNAHCHPHRETLAHLRDHRVTMTGAAAATDPHRCLAEAASATADHRVVGEDVVREIPTR